MKQKGCSLSFGHRTASLSNCRSLFHAVASVSTPRMWSSSITRLRWVAAFNSENRTSCRPAAVTSTPLCFWFAFGAFCFDFSKVAILFFNCLFLSSNPFSRKDAWSWCLSSLLISFLTAFRAPFVHTTTLQQSVGLREVVLWSIYHVSVLLCFLLFVPANSEQLQWHFAYPRFDQSLHKDWRYGSFLAPDGLSSSMGGSGAWRSGVRR